CDLIRHYRQFDCRRLSEHGTSELLAVLGETGHEASVREEELAVLQAHEAIQPVCLAGAVVAEAGVGYFQPLALVGPEPLVPIERLAAQVAVGAAEVLAERVEPAKPAAVVRGSPR